MSNIQTFVKTQIWNQFSSVFSWAQTGLQCTVALQVFRFESQNNCSPHQFIFVVGQSYFSPHQFVFVVNQNYLFTASIYICCWSKLFTPNFGKICIQLNQKNKTLDDELVFKLPLETIQIVIKSSQYCFLTFIHFLYFPCQV